MAVIKRGRGRPPSSSSPSGPTKTLAKTTNTGAARRAQAKSIQPGSITQQASSKQNGGANTAPLRPTRERTKGSPKSQAVRKTRGRATEDHDSAMTEPYPDNFHAEAANDSTPAILTDIASGGTENGSGDRGLDELAADTSSEALGTSNGTHGNQALAYSSDLSPTTRPRTMEDVERSTTEGSLRDRYINLGKRYAQLETRYHDLQYMATKEAEDNFERLKKQAEDRAKVSSQLVASLKAEVVAQSALSSDTQELKSQLASKNSQIEQLEQQITDLTTSLTHARAEMKAMSLKLSAARSTDTSALRPPGSAVKLGKLGQAPPRGGASSEMLPKAQLKEDLYAELTGLLIRDIKLQQSEAGVETVYDCIQTGRNGTLHFKLAMSDEAETQNYDDVQFTYMPQLDSGRDVDLINLLPDYLAEEITFPRPHVVNFYARVTRSLTERPDS